MTSHSVLQPKYFPIVRNKTLHLLIVLITLEHFVHQHISPKLCYSKHRWCWWFNAKDHLKNFGQFYWMFIQLKISLSFSLLSSLIRTALSPSIIQFEASTIIHRRKLSSILSSVIFKLMSLFSFRVCFDHMQCVLLPRYVSTLLIGSK